MCWADSGVGKAGVNRADETRGRKSISATISVTLADLLLRIQIYLVLWGRGLPGQTDIAINGIFTTVGARG